MTTLTVTARGQVTFRKDVLQHLGIRPGDKIELDLLPDGRGVLKAARPAADLRKRFAQQAGAIDAVLQAAGRQADNTLYVPMVGRKAFWTVFIDPVSAQPVAFMPLDSF